MARGAPLPGCPTSDRIGCLQVFLNGRATRNCGAMCWRGSRNVNEASTMTPAAFKAAAVQFEPTMFEKERNIERLAKWVRRAAEAGSRLIVTPEMATTGYCWYERSEIKPFVETVPGPTTARFQEISREFNTYIVIGMPEIDVGTDLYYNTAVLIGPEGVIGKHRKSHPYISEPKWAASGDTHAVFETPLGRIGLLICMDLHFIET